MDATDAKIIDARTLYRLQVCQISKVVDARTFYRLQVCQIPKVVDARTPYRLQVCQISIVACSFRAIKKGTKPIRFSTRFNINYIFA